MFGLGVTELSPGFFLPAPTPTDASEETLGWADIVLQTFEGSRQRVQGDMRKPKVPCAKPASVQQDNPWRKN